MGHSVRQSKSYLSRTLFYSIQSFCLKMRKALCIQPLGFVALSVILLKSLAFGYLCGFDPQIDGRTAVTDDQIPKWEKNTVNFMFDSTATQEDRKTFAKAIRKIRKIHASKDKVLAALTPIVLMEQLVLLEHILL